MGAYIYVNGQPTRFTDPSGLLKGSNFNPFSDDFGGKHNPVKLRWNTDPISLLVLHAPIVLPAPKHGTFGACVGGSANVPFLYGSADACYVWSAHQTGATLTVGGGSTTSPIPSIGGHLTGQWSNATCLSGLGSWFVGGGATADIGPGLTGTGMTSPDGRVKTVNVGVTLQSPQTEVRSAAAYTFVLPFPGWSTR